MSEYKTENFSKSNSSLIKWFLIILFIWAIPSCLLWTGVYLFINEECERKDNQTLFQLERELETISYDNSSSRYFQSKLSNLFNNLNGRPCNPVSSLQNVLNAILKKYPDGLLDVYLFNGEGKIIETKGAHKEFETFIKLATSDYANGLITDEETKEIGEFIPEPTMLIKRIRGQKGRAVETGNPDRYSLCYYNQEDLQRSDKYVSGILIFVHYEKLKNSLILSETLAQQSSKIGFLDPRESRLPTSLSDTSINEIFIENYFKLYPTNRFRQDSKLVCMKKLNNDGILVGAVEMNKPAWSLFSIILVFFVIASFYFLKLTYSVYVLNLNLGFNIRKRLTGLFVLCYVFPLITAAILASQYLMELKNSLLAKEEFSNYKRLSEIDSGFSRFITSKLMEYRNFTKELTDYVENPTTIADRLKEKVLNNYIDSVHIVASTSKTLLSSEIVSAEVRRHYDKSYEEQQQVLSSWMLRHAVLAPKQISYLFDRQSINSFPEEKDRAENHKSFVKVISGTAVSAMEYYNQSHNISTALTKKNNSNLVLEALITSNAQGFFQAMKTNLSNFTVLGSIDEILYVFADIIPGPMGDAWYAYATITNLENLERIYLEEIFNDIKIKDKHINRVFYEEDIRAISTFPFATCFPTLMEFTKFESLLKQSNSDSKTFTHKMVLDGEDTYVSVLRGAYLKNYLLLYVFPESKIEQQYKKQVNTVILLFVVIMVMGLALARLMTSLLILPITDIISGVKAIANKNYDYQIKVRSENEFGIMAKAFNQTAQSLKEMDINKTLGDYLFPDNEFRCGSYLINASRLSSKFVTCDFYDYIQLKSGTFAFITAKIPGNDAVSAYLMAMLKTTFITLITTFPHSPDVVMNRLNKIFMPYSKAGHTMSCFIGLLDPTNDIMLCTNAGQPYPIVVSEKKNEKKFVDLPSTSLGITSNAKYSKVEISLKHKVLVLYSYGACEVTNQSGIKLGRKNLLEIVANSIKEEKKNPSDAILKKINEFSINVPWREDISILTIHNRF